MASYNRVVILGRCTRDVEVKAFANGGKVAKIGFATDGNRKKNPQTGKWESEPVFLDCEVFNRGENGKLADTAEQYLSKGKQVLIEGRLTQQNWTAQDGAKRSKIVVVVDSFQMLDSKPREERGEPRQYMPRDQPDVRPSYAPDDSVPEDSIPF